MVGSGNTEGAGSNAAVVNWAIRLGFLALLVYWTLIIVQPLLATIIWSVIIAVALYPVFEWLAAVLNGSRRVAAVLLTVACLLIALGPLAWAALSLIDSVQVVSLRIEAGELVFPPPIAAIKNVPLVGPQLYELWELATTNFSSALTRLGPQIKPLGSALLGLARTISTGILVFIASVIIAGFLFVPGPSLVRALKAFCRRVIGARADEFVELAASTISRVSRGVIGIAILQAGLGGVGLQAAHVPGVTLITFAALVLGIIQVGPGILFIPIIVWSWFVMEPTKALLFTAYMIPVGLVDNVLRPIIMGRGLVTPMPVVFVGLIGGVIAHGVIGVFIGPIVLAVAWGLLVAWVGNDEPSITPPKMNVVNLSGGSSS